MHGGPDALGVPRWDFSSNANACGPAPAVLQALRQADASRYPDPAYTALRRQLAALHEMPAERILLAASASEFIVRFSTAVALQRPAARVFAPSPGYGDYARAAAACGLALSAEPGRAELVWHTEPASPLGDSRPPPAVADGALRVIDCAYGPLRLEGIAPALPPDAWQLHTPNKALGLTGVRAAYAIAPPGARALQRRLEQLCPSWPVGAHGVAMLQAWAEQATQHWLHDSRAVLRGWKARQLELCRGLGWTCHASVTPFFAARGPGAAQLQRLRALGIKLRDAASLGLPGWVRLSVQPPSAQDALAAAWGSFSRVREKAGDEGAATCAEPHPHPSPLPRAGEGEKT